MIPGVQIPDFAGTLARTQQLQQQGELSRLQMLAQQQAMADDKGFRGALAEVAPALGGNDPAARMSALTRLMELGGVRGTQIALPLIQRERDTQEYEARQRGGGFGGVPAMPAAPAGGADPIARIAAVESGGNDGARNPNSSASGRFQIIDSTWNQYAPRLGLRPEQRNDPAAQEQIARAIQAEAAQAVGRPLTPGEAYGAHFLGLGGLRAFLSADPNADARAVYAQAAGPRVAEAAFRSNPGLLEPGMTVGQVMNALDRRMGGATVLTGDATPAPSRTGIDPAELRRIEQGLASPNEMIRRSAAARLQSLQFQMRDGTSEPLEAVVGRNGQPQLVPRSQAVGMQPFRTPAATVNLNPGDGPRMRADMKTLEAINENMGQARQLLAFLDRAEQAVRAVPEGAGAQFVPALGQAARAVGIDLPGTSEAEVLRGIQNTLASLQRIPGSGATTDFEMRLYMQAVPRLGNTREGNLQLIDMGRRLTQRRIEEANIWRRHAGAEDLFDRLDALGPVFTRDQMRILQNDAAPAEGPGAAPPPPPPGFRIIR